MRWKYSDSQLIYSTCDYSFFVALACFTLCVSVYVCNMCVVHVKNDVHYTVCYEFSFFCASHTIFTFYSCHTTFRLAFSIHVYIEWRIKWRVYDLFVLIFSIFLQFFDRTKFVFFSIYCICHWFSTTSKTTNHNRVNMNKDNSADTDANYKNDALVFLGALMKVSHSLYKIIYSKMLNSHAKLS